MRVTASVQALDELLRGEDEGGCAISPRTFELELDAPVFEQPQAVEGDWRSRQVPRHAFEAVKTGTLGGGYKGGRVDGS
jgi:hypothetical protein